MNPLTASRNDRNEKEVIYGGGGNKYAPSPKGALKKIDNSKDGVS